MATPPSTLTNTLRRSLLIKVISKPAPSKEDVNSVIELTASKVVETLQCQSMTLYLVEGGEIDAEGDHRIAMSFAMAALRASGPVTIHNAANIATSSVSCGNGLA